MLRVGLTAPHFNCSAVVAGRLIRLDWPQLHDQKTLLLLFDAHDGRSQAPDELLAVSNAVARRGGPRARVGVVCRQDLEETLARVHRDHSVEGPQALAFPLIVDPDGRIAALYGLPADGRVPVWGHFLIDPSGVIQRAEFSGFPVFPGVEELLRSVRASGFPAETELWN